MIEVQLNLDNCTLDDVRRFVELTKGVDGNAQPFQPDYSVDHPAALIAEIE